MKPFTAPALFASYDGVRVPTAAQLLPMTCHELSETCISFFLDTLPEFETVVVRLAHGDEEPIDLSARILDVRAHSGNRYLARCQFIGRLYL